MAPGACSSAPTPLSTAARHHPKLRADASDNGTDRLDLAWPRDSPIPLPALDTLFAQAGSPHPPSDADLAAMLAAGPAEAARDDEDLEGRRFGINDVEKVNMANTILQIAPCPLCRGQDLGRLVGRQISLVGVFGSCLVASQELHIANLTINEAIEKFIE